MSPELWASATQGGYAELAAYDSNGDGRISVGDLIRSELQIWQDYDRDGVTDAGKVSVPKSLARGANDNEQDAWRAAAFHFDGWEMAA